MEEIAPGIRMIDTLLGGMEQVTAAYLVDGERPALIETGARTSASALRRALREAGLAPGDLAWLVLTHVHLDHCGGTGIVSAAFPRATVVVHRRGARHLAEPGRLVAASAEVYGARWALYGGLDRTPAERIVAADDGHRVPVGPGRDLVLLETTGHARHHMAVHDEATGTVFAGDAVGATVAGGGLYPMLPPPDVDLDAGVRSVARIAGLEPERVLLPHFGPLPDPAADLALAAELMERARAATEGAGPGREALAEALERALPLDATVADERSAARLRRLGWVEANVDGLQVWREARAA
ncbi:MAG TPA: MBL fold metallo-hydrolase [Miltoncostaeaceae bacterium]|nr:MBL fold metallo-hydrolase [Miltoncostaeaceae bacterium]